jgi:hypothetical protein
MRYIIITYMQRAAGRGQKMQQDEVVEVTKRVKPRDLDLGSVILDFRDRTVIKASVGDQIAPRDFQRIRDYYYQHYRDLINQLEQIYNEKQDNPG